jgi:hypothetical protein
MSVAPATHCQRTTEHTVPNVVGEESSGGGKFRLGILIHLPVLGEYSSTLHFVYLILAGGKNK